VLTPAGAVSDAYRAFFERYRAVLSQDFERQLLRRHLASFRWFNSYLAYRTLFFRTLQSEGVIPGDDMFRVIPLRHIEARWRDDLSDLPPACHRVTPPLQSVVAVQERVAEIPTRLRVASECDRQLLATAAAKVVAQQRESILKFLDAPVERAGPQP
jgi:hypothetical protein